MNLKALRVSADLSRKEVANELGVTVETYRKKESKMAPLKLEEGFVLARLFGVSIEGIRDALQ